MWIWDKIIMERWWPGPTQGWLVWGLYLELLTRSRLPALDHSSPSILSPQLWSSWPFQLGGLGKAGTVDSQMAHLLGSSLSSLALPPSPALSYFCFSVRSELKCFFLFFQVALDGLSFCLSVPLQHH